MTSAEYRPVAYVLDQHGLLDYATERSLVAASLVAAAREHDRRIAVSALAVGHAYVLAEPEQADRLDLLTGDALAALVVVAPFDRVTARDVGRGADPGQGERDLARLHMAALAREYDAIVVTSEPDPLRDLLGEAWTIVEL